MKVSSRAHEAQAGKILSVSLTWYFIMYLQLLIQNYVGGHAWKIRCIQEVENPSEERGFRTG